MTNQLNPPAAFAATGAPDAVPPTSEDPSFASRPEDHHLPVPAEVVTVVDLPSGVFAPLVVVGSMESARALDAARILPGPARILVVSSLEALAALRLPKPQGENELSAHVQGGLALQHPRRVVFAPDGTPESLQAARQAARHARAAGWTVDGLPAPQGARWTDVLLGHVRPSEADVARIADMWVPFSDTDRWDGPHEDDLEGHPSEAA